ncbi:MAG TPA: hypothetical protein PLL78_05850 [Fimbriimonadaceae bacterium]|nr:hypothetical protein [Fimbriimonadaceae bacterium]HRJ96191.1 hypothetical protein [Fimbriimonadaceae bacterium]
MLVALLAFQLPAALDLKADETWADRITLTYTDKADGFTMTYVDRWEWTVGSVDSDGNAWLKRRRKNLETRMDGQPIPGGDEQTISLTLSSRGALKQFQAGEVDPGIETRLARILTVILPASAKDTTWTYEYPDIADAKIPGLSVEYRAIREEDRTRLSISVRELGRAYPMTGAGTAELDAKGRPQRLDLRLKSAIIPGSEGQRCDLHVILEREKPPSEKPDRSGGLP